ncbi:MAG: M20/M25/M40 family metallo-hydrolase [Candidatus Thermoplasmatota archaeon]
MQNRNTRLLVILSVILVVTSTFTMTSTFSSREDKTQLYRIDKLEEGYALSGETPDIPLFDGYDRRIHQIMNKTEDSNIYEYIDTLQNFENENGTRTRRDGTQGFERAVNWTYHKLDSFGLEVFKQNFTYSESESSNMIAELDGSDPELEDETYMIGAHLDSINSDEENESAPGADDNGSGIALMVEAARILSQYEFNRTIRFAAWGGEELGLHGSTHYASNIDPEEEDLKGYLNYDMVGYAEEDIPAITLHSNQHSNWMLDYQKNLAEAYEIDLNFTYEYDSTQARSDHASFWEEGYDASLAIESEFNPNYHSEEDTLDKLNTSQIIHLTSHAIGTAAHLAESQVEVEPPLVEIQSPEGGKSWQAKNEEKITWETTVGSGNITGIRLEYDLDNNSSWTDIATDLDDTGSYLWSVPEESTSEGRIRVTVYDEHGLISQDISGFFTIEKEEAERDTPGPTLPGVVLSILAALIVRHKK